MLPGPSNFVAFQEALKHLGEEREANNNELDSGSAFGNRRRYLLHRQRFITGRIRDIYNNYHFSERIIDLHYLYLSEVKAYLPKALQKIFRSDKALRRTTSFVKFITGYRNGQTIRKHIKQQLQQHPRVIRYDDSWNHGASDAKFSL